MALFLELKRFFLGTCCCLPEQAFLGRAKPLSRAKAQRGEFLQKGQSKTKGKKYDPFSKAGFAGSSGDFWHLV